MATTAADPLAIVVLGGSAGAVTALQALVASFPGDFRAAVFVVTHTPSESISALPHILARAGPLFATHAIDGAPLAPGRIVVCPPNHHLVIDRQVMRVVDWAKENGYRPAIDVLFRTAAQSHGSAVCGALLSGTLDDGVAGLRAIREAGGTAMVQDPADALFGDMPRNAIEARVVDVVGATGELAESLTACVDRIVGEGHVTASDYVAPDERIFGKPSALTCPDCGGTLWELETDESLRFRCRTGHAYSPNSMVGQQRTYIEESLWSAIRLLEERETLLRRLASRAERRGDRLTAERFEKQAANIAAHQDGIRDAISELIAQRQSSVS